MKPRWLFTSGRLPIFFPPGSNFTTTSYVYTTTFLTCSFYSTDNASPVSPSSPVSILYLLWSQKKQTWLIKESTLYNTGSDLSKSFVSSKTSFTKSEESSTTSRYPLLWNPLSLQSPQIQQIQQFHVLPSIAIEKCSPWAEYSMPVSTQLL